MSASATQGSRNKHLPIAHWEYNKFFLVFLWPPCVADADIIFLSCFFFFFSSPNLSGRRLDAYHTCIHGVVLVQI